VCVDANTNTHTFIPISLTIQLSLLRFRHFWTQPNATCYTLACRCVSMRVDACANVSSKEKTLASTRIDTHRHAPTPTRTYLETSLMIDIRSIFLHFICVRCFAAVSTRVDACRCVSMRVSGCTLACEHERYQAKHFSPIFVFGCACMWNEESRVVL